MNKQTGLITGTTLLFISSVIIFLGRLGTSVVVARTLGPELKGIYNLTLLSSGLVMIISNLGLTGAITYFIASKSFSSRQIFSLAILAGLALSIIGGAIFFAAYDSFLVKNILVGSDRRLILWVILGLPLSLLTSYLSSMLLGQQRMFAYNTVDVFRVLANLVFQIISSLVSHRVEGAVIAWLCANGLALILALWLLRGEINLQTKHLPQLLPAVLSYGGKSYAGNLLMFFNYRLDSFLVNFFRGVAAVGQYTTSVSLAELLWYIPNAVSGALFPKVSTLDKDTAAQVTARACRQTLLIVCLAAIGFSLFGGWVLVGFYGEAFRPAIKPFSWLLPGMVGLAMTKIISADMSGRGKPQFGAYVAGMTVILTLIFDFILIPTYGITGAAIASSIAYISSAAMSVIWVYRETGIPPKTMLIPRLEDIKFLTNKGIDLTKRLVHSSVAGKGNR